MNKIQELQIVRRAFTLIELLVVISVIALLLSVMLPSLNKARESGRKVVCGTRLKQMGLALQMYAQDNKGNLPPLFSDSHFGWDFYLPNYIPNSEMFSHPTMGQIAYNKIFRCPSDTEARLYTPALVRSYIFSLWFLPGYSGGYPSDFSIFNNRSYNVNKIRSSNIVALVESHRADNYALNESGSIAYVHPKYGYYIGYHGGKVVRRDRYGVILTSGGKQNYLWMDGRVESLAESPSEQYFKPVK